jgi:hypothetical protein
MWQPSSAQPQQTTSSAEGGGGPSMGFQTIGDARNGFLKPPRYMSISRTRHRSGGRWATIDDEVDHTPRLIEPRSPRGQLAASQPPFEASKLVTAPIDVVLTRRVPPPLHARFHS